MAKGKRYDLRMDDVESAQLMELAKLWDLKMSATIRRAVKEAHEREIYTGVEMPHDSV